MGKSTLNKAWPQNSKLQFTAGFLSGYDPLFHNNNKMFKWAQKCWCQFYNNSTKIPHSVSVNNESEDKPGFSTQLPNSVLPSPQWCTNLSFQCHHDEQIIREGTKGSVNKSLRQISPSFTFSLPPFLTLVFPSFPPSLRKCMPPRAQKICYLPGEIERRRLPEREAGMSEWKLWRGRRER